LHSTIKAFSSYSRQGRENFFINNGY